MNLITKIICVLVLALSTNMATAKKPVKPPPEAGNLQNIVTVSAENGDFTNPIDAINSIINASEMNLYLIQIGPGIYNLGANQLVMKEWVRIQGSGREVTKIIGTLSTDINDATSALVVGSNNAGLMDLTIENSGGAFGSIAIYNNNASPRIERVIASASGGSGVNGGVSNWNGSSPIMTHVTASASGEHSSFGIYNNDSSPVMTNVIATASGGTTNIGVNSSGGSPVMINITASASTGTTNVGIYNVFSSPFIQNSVLEGSPGLWIKGGSDNTRVVNSMITGGVTDVIPASEQCRGTYDESLADVAC